MEGKLIIFWDVLLIVPADILDVIRRVSCIVGSWYTFANVTTIIGFL
jgi:hypothetical protein